MNEHQPINPIFMIGTGRRGTSALSEAISTHNDLGWISNYLNVFPRFPVFSILNRLTTIPNWGIYLRGKKKQPKGLLSTIRRYMPYSAESYPVWEYCLGKKFSTTYLIGEKATQEEIIRTRKHFNKILTYQGKEILFTKYTGPPRMAFLASIFPKAAFIHVIRDPMAVVSSLLNVSFWKKGGGFDKPCWEGGLSQRDLDDWKRYGKTPAALAAVQWRLIIELADQESPQVSGRYFEIRYEDFIDSPHEMLSDTFLHLGLSDDLTAHYYIDSWENVELEAQIQGASFRGGRRGPFRTSPGMWPGKRNIRFDNRQMLTNK